MHSALTLYRLYHHCDRILRAGILKGFEIIERSIGKSGGHIAESDLAGIIRLSGCAHGAECSSVE